MVSDEADLLGAGDKTPKNSYVAVFVPSRTRSGYDIDHASWVQEAVEVLSQLFGGATAVEGFGGWFDEECGQVLTERVSMVVSFISEEEWNRAKVRELRRFLHRMGRETEQGEVGLLVQNCFYRIVRFDDE